MTRVCQCRGCAPRSGLDIINQIYSPGREVSYSSGSSWSTPSGGTITWSTTMSSPNFYWTTYTDVNSTDLTYNDIERRS